MRPCSRRRRLPSHPAQLAICRSAQRRLRERQKLSKKYVAIAAKLVAPVVDTDIVAGFQWVVETLRAQSHFELATEMEIAKALYYMRSRQFEQAIETRKRYP